MENTLTLIKFKKQNNRFKTRELKATACRLNVPRMDQGFFSGFLRYLGPDMIQPNVEDLNPINMTMLPVGSARRNRAVSKLDFPAPVLPTIPIFSCFLILKLTPFSTSLSPSAYLRFSTVRPPRRRITVGLAGLGLLVQLGELHHPLHGGHQVLHLGRLSDAILQHPGEHDAAGDGEADIAAYNISSGSFQSSQTPNHLVAIRGRQTRWRCAGPVCSLTRTSPGALIVVRPCKEVESWENTWRLPGISQLG